MQFLRQEIKAVMAARLSQLAISLEDQGEPGPLGGAGDMPEWDRPPFDQVVWIGPTAAAERVIEAILTDPAVGEVLCAGAAIRVSGCYPSDLESQRSKAEALEMRLAAGPPSAAMPTVDQAIFHATRLAAVAAAPDIKPPPGPSSTGAQNAVVGDAPALSVEPEVIGQWSFHLGRASYAGKPVPLTETQLKIVRLLAKQTEPVIRERLIKAVWENQIGYSGTSSTFSKTRDALRAALGLRSVDDPLPTDRRGGITTIRLDDELLRRVSRSKE